VKKAGFAFVFYALMLHSAFAQATGGAPTYNSDVAPLLAGNCMQCHRPGQVAPTLMRYEDARTLSGSIKERVVARSMPPWHADPSYGVFVNERRLSDEQIRTIASWVDAGAPRGDPRQTPLLPEFTSEWPLGQPDLVFPAADELTISAGGSDVFHDFEIATSLPQDVWVVGVEIRSNERVARGASVFVEDAQGVRERLASGVPAEMYEVFPNGSARLMKAGSKLVIAMHYTPSATPQTDKPSVGLVTAKGPVIWQIVSASVDGLSEFVFPQAAELIEMMPRAGEAKAVKYTAVYPDNRGEILLSIPQYDPDWQVAYKLAGPKVMPSGTRLQVEATESPDPIEGWFDYRVRR
jgi:mono/diheme cytochrome c family protein